ncbi:unnamed protein product [Chilo suppressalis]|uniref:CHK kinase-like domain-containing protein n=1 Tax=Chilo suppressalis TaxID=168631 RepID=A0ABN8AYK4_CHISP|nr:unnamed protein product [Chilo suppressalis]
MELLTNNEVEEVIKQLGYTKSFNWTLSEFSETLVGYLSEHLTLTVEVLTAKFKTERIKFFIKCLPRFDEWKTRYIKELSFFQKEYVMLNDLFRKIEQGTFKWRPRCLLVREDLFVFEDVTELGYQMPSTRSTFELNQLKACVISLAKFHAQSYIFEEKRSKELNRPYRISDEYSEYLKDPERCSSWRDAGRNAVIDYLKVYSKQKDNPKFISNIESVITTLYDMALSLMKPSSKYRNTVVHRDLWANNIFLKKDCDGNINAMFVDFQTVIYCSPMLDLSSLLYFNTNRVERASHTGALLDFYYEKLSEELSAAHINVSTIMDRMTFNECYKDSVIFAIIQASLIVPIVVIQSKTRDDILREPDSSHRFYEVSRSKEFIAIALQDDYYRYRVTDLFEEIVDRYIVQPDE